MPKEAATGPFGSKPLGLTRRFAWWALWNGFQTLPGRFFRPISCLHHQRLWDLYGVSEDSSPLRSMSLLSCMRPG